MKPEDALRRFGEAYLELLIATEIVSRGTGPEKYMHDGTQNTIVFDTCLLPEDELPEIWHDPDIVSTRELALIHPDERPGDFEKRFRDAREKVYLKYYSLIKDAKTALDAIPPGIERDTRQDEIDSLTANYEYAGYHILKLFRPPSFEQAQTIITGVGNVHTLDSIGAIKQKLEGMLTEKRITSGTFKERMMEFEKLAGYVLEDKMISEYERVLSVIA